MPANIIDGVVTFVGATLNVEVWDGEIPRYTPEGAPIRPDVTGSPTTWPVVKAFMQEGGFEREPTTEDPYTDRGEILIQVWGTTRAQVEAPEVGMLNQIEALLAHASNWGLINIGGPPNNLFYVIALELRRWYSGQEEGVRTNLGELLYRGELHYDVMIHGIISTS